MIRYVSIDGDGAYPVEISDGDTDTLEWTLRHGTPEQVYKARLAAASIVSAYRSLLGATRDRREQVVRAIRKAGAR